MSNSRKIVQVTVIGVGGMGQRHVRVFCAAGGATVAGVVDTSDARARSVAERFGVARLKDEAEAIARADLVVIATPIGAHAAMVERALDAGRHVLVEKPLCARAVDAERLLAIAERRGAHLFVGHSERFNPVVRALAERVRPDDVRALDFCRVGTPSSPLGRAHDGGVLLNLGVHDIDLAAWLTRQAPTLRRAEGDETRAQLLLAHANGIFARVRVDRAAQTRRRIVRVMTSEAAFEGDLLAPRLVRRDPAGRAEEIPLDGAEPLAAQAAAALDALAGRASPIATGLDGARALAVAEQAAALIGRAEALPARAAEKL